MVAESVCLQSKSMQSSCSAACSYAYEVVQCETVGSADDGSIGPSKKALRGKHGAALGATAGIRQTLILTSCGDCMTMCEYLGLL